MIEHFSLDKLQLQNQPDHITHLDRMLSKTFSFYLLLHNSKKYNIIRVRYPEIYYPYFYFI